MRDLILGRPVSDLDFTTDARPEQTERVLAGWADAVWDVGRAFGTIGARRGEHTVEITTYRSEAYDRTSRKPEVVYGDSLADDLVRRDFTVNAMALVLPEQRFVDPHGGLQDLVAGVLRTPGTPEESFGDDPLRMLRAARFAAQAGVRRRARGDGGDGRHGAAARDRVGRADPGRAWRRPCCRRRRGAGSSLVVETGLAQVFLPEPAVPATGDRRAPPAQGRLRALADRARPGHRARGRRRAGTRPGAAARRAAARHRQAADPPVRGRGRRELPPPRGGRRQDGRQAAEGAAVRHGHRQGGRPAGRACTCGSTGTATAPGPTRRCAATSPTPARCSVACTG
ncbi:hypothetical protein GCM10025868_23400 [Angustibacter aerolatus]|uniref:Poly A polymerase head domain-containing protein n=1 Tax=Angustibacter aerolatus TaxID=1162965 RepID=A0ABQ6JFX1_9ACTN|nr:hypothetical protein GCM10025868_23400 [Angustibacter aerolatus]